MSVDERMWKIIKRRFGYTDDELNTFKKNPRNADVLSKSAELNKKIFVLKVVEAHGCNSLHKIGEQYFFDGTGNLLIERCSKNICVHVLSAAATLIFTAQELMYAGVDPNEMRFNRAPCLDVGLECGGWGRVVVELRAEDKE
jgi:uncharacterized repeat protein (TIGR04076 family)